MSLFKTKGVVLKKDKMGDKDFLYTIFSSDYGKILCNKKLSKTEKTLDSGYLINFEVETKQNRKIHKIKNIKILSEFRTENKKFTEINSYLELLYIIHKNAPDGLQVVNIIDIFEQIHKVKDISEDKIILAKLKALNIFGLLKIIHPDTTVEKILKFIDTNNMSRIILLAGISDEVKNKLNILSK